MAFSGICSPLVMRIRLNLAEAGRGRGFTKDNCGVHHTGIHTDAIPSRVPFACVVTSDRELGQKL